MAVVLFDIFQCAVWYTMASCRFYFIAVGGCGKQCEWEESFLSNMLLSIYEILVYF